MKLTKFIIIVFTSE